MLSEQEKTLWYLREAGNVKRNHNWPCQQEQRVGQHVYGALTIYLLYHPMPELDTIIELQFHDSGERIAGDAPAPAKWTNPAFKTEYEHIEQRVKMKNGVPVYKLSEIEKIWVKACDQVDFLLYTWEEMLQGNKYAEPRHLTSLTAIRENMRLGLFPTELHALITTVTENGYKPFSDMELMP